MAKLSSLTYFVFMLNAAIDTGRHQDITISEVQAHIDRGDIFPYLQERLGRDIDLGILISEEYAATDARDITRGLQDILAVHEGRERRKWGVENSGLCLLVAWVTELIQQEEWE